MNINQVAEERAVNWLKNHRKIRPGSPEYLTGCLDGFKSGFIAGAAKWHQMDSAPKDEWLLLKTNKKIDAKIQIGCYKSLAKAWFSDNYDNINPIEWTHLPKDNPS